MAQKKKRRRKKKINAFKTEPKAERKKKKYIIISKNIVNIGKYCIVYLYTEIKIITNQSHIFFRFSPIESKLLNTSQKSSNNTLQRTSYHNGPGI